MNLKFFIFFVIFIASCECSRILLVHTSLSKSHILPMQVLAKELAKRGHQITFISPFPLNKPIENYRDVKVELTKEDAEFYEELAKDLGQNPGGKSTLKLLSIITNLFTKFGNETLQSTAVRNLMNEEEFDLVIAGYFLTDYLLGLADHFKCPSIVFSSGHYASPLSKMVGNPLSPSAAPHGMLNSKEMNFINRVKNFMFNILDYAIIRPYFNYRAKIIYDFNFPPDKYRSYDEMLSNVSLVLINTHFSSASPRPILPNMVEVGGLQIKPKPSPLPDDLKDFLDNAKDGSILFTFGSNTRISYLPSDKIKAMLKVFSKLKQRVVMKWEADEMPDKPDNVFIGNWLPQDDLLAHQSMKLFISHCGYGGVIEAKFNGVPIICVPFGADQTSNSDKAVDEGWAIRLDFDDLNENSLSLAINEILSNAKYRDYVKRESILSRDRPLNAQETAIYWIEYVLRHHGAPHLHYAGADLNFFQDNSIDVLLFFAVIIYGVFKIIKIVCCFICCRKKKDKNHKIKRN